MTEIWDTIILGAGSAGMAAAIYAARFNLKTLVIGKVVGGLLNDSHNVENYPGYKSISGFDLMMKFKEHMDNLNVPQKDEWAKKIVQKGSSPKERVFEIHTQDEDGNEHVYNGRTLVIATGAKHRKLNAPGEEQLAGKGVSYCATCDAAFFRNVPVAIVGGGDSAAIAGNLLTQFASKVYIIVRRDHMRAEPINRQRIEDSDKVEIIYNTEVKEVLGENEVTGVRLSTPYNGSETLSLQGVFVEIGQAVNSELAEQLGVQLNERKEIIINDKSETNVEGVFAAGDVGDRTYKQALTGASEGAIAAFGAYALLQNIDEHKKADISY